MKKFNIKIFNRNIYKTIKFYNKLSFKKLFCSLNFENKEKDDYNKLAYFDKIGNSDLIKKVNTETDLFSFDYIKDNIDFSLITILNLNQNNSNYDNFDPYINNDILNLDYTSNVNDVYNYSNIKDFFNSIMYYLITNDNKKFILISYFFNKISSSFSDFNEFKNLNVKNSFNLHKKISKQDITDLNKKFPNLQSLSMVVKDIIFLYTEDFSQNKNAKLSKIGVYDSNKIKYDFKNMFIYDLELIDVDTVHNKNRNEM